ncbi:MAG: winged helix-turn-helix transcriptional regulator [Epulopiscium sp.]|jgi:ArsR family transcriptional regulator|nr:winged helix-turn-helix transcriptional regulator [Candidatus Epulonipiscium sp.]
MEKIVVASISKALGDTNRLEIIQMLSDGEKCGCKLLEKFDITQPTLSYHMKILVECGLVNDRKEGKWHHYSLNCEMLKEYREFIEALSCVDSKKCCCDGGIK